MIIDSKNLNMYRTSKQAPKTVVREDSRIHTLIKTNCWKVTSLACISIYLGRHERRWVWATYGTSRLEKHRIGHWQQQTEALWSVGQQIHISLPPCPCPFSSHITSQASHTGTCCPTTNGARRGGSKLLLILSAKVYLCLLLLPFSSSASSVCPDLGKFLIETLFYE